MLSYEQSKLRGLALCQAAEKLDLATIELMLGGDGLPCADLGCTDKYGDPPIALACDSEEDESLIIPIVERLLQAGFDVNGCNESVTGEENTPLMNAVVNDHVALAQFLIDHGADPTLNNRSRENALEKAIYSDTGTLRSFIGMLKSHFGEAEFIDFANRGTGVMHQAARFGLVNVMDVLVEEGVQLDGLNDRGERPLHYVAANCNDVHGAHGLMHLVRLGATVTPDVWRSRNPAQAGSTRRFGPCEGMWALMLTTDPSAWPDLSAADAGMSKKTPLTRLAAAMHLGDHEILMEMVSHASNPQEIGQLQRDAQLIHELNVGNGSSRRVGDAFALVSAHLSQQLIAHISRSRGPSPV